MNAWFSWPFPVYLPLYEHMIAALKEAFGTANVLDLACGRGLASIALLHAGATVTSLDAESRDNTLLRFLPQNLPHKYIMLDVKHVDIPSLTAGINMVYLSWGQGCSKKSKEIMDVVLANGGVVAIVGEAYYGCTFPADNYKNKNGITYLEIEIQTYRIAADFLSLAARDGTQGAKVIEAFK